MIEHRRFSALAQADYGWLKSHYHFALSRKGNLAHAALGPIVVWNDDEIAAGAGFPPHGHADMEIVAYVREGTLVHRDNFGNAGDIKAGDVQVILRRGPGSSSSPLRACALSTVTSRSSCAWSSACEA